MTGDIFFMRWARPDGAYAPHSETPTVSECEAEGYYIVCRDWRSVLMRLDQQTSEVPK